MPSESDILVTVNFTTLGIPPDSRVNILQNSVEVMLSLTDDSLEASQRTIPTLLMRGTNLVGVATKKVYQKAPTFLCIWDPGCQFFMFTF